MSRRKGQTACPLFAWNPASADIHSCHCTQTCPLCHCDDHCDQIIIVIRSSLWSDVNFVMESLLLVFTRVIQTWLSCIGRSGVWKFSDTSWKIVHQDHHWHYKGCVDDQKRESYVPGTQIKKVKVMYLAPRVPENLGHEVWGVRSGTLVNNLRIFLY